MMMLLPFIQAKSLRASSSDRQYRARDYQNFVEERMQKLACISIKAAASLLPTTILPRMSKSKGTTAATNGKASKKDKTVAPAAAKAAPVATKEKKGKKSKKAPTPPPVESESSSSEEDSEEDESDSDEDSDVSDVHSASTSNVLIHSIASRTSHPRPM